MHDELDLIAAADKKFEVSADLSTLSLAMKNGPRLVLSAETLRSHCKCAYCTRARFDGRFPDRFPGIVIVEVADLGYGFNIAFSDGHNRGIYPLTYLAGLTSG